MNVYALHLNGGFQAVITTEEGPEVAKQIASTFVDDYFGNEIEWTEGSMGDLEGGYNISSYERGRIRLEIEHVEGTSRI